MIKQIRGWHVAVMFLAFFGVTMGVNAVFITMAYRTHPGEDVPRSYVQGLNYNDALDRRRAQAELGWTARVNQVGQELLIEVRDAAGETVTGLDLVGSMNHPTDTSQDCVLAFREGREGLYRVDLPCGGEGVWRLRARNDGDTPFELEHVLRWQS